MTRHEIAHPESPFQEGNPDSKVLFLLEAPARTEIRMQRPLVGPSGHLFDQSLHAAKLIRRASYILNLFEEPVIRKKNSPNLFDQNGEILWTKKGLTEIGIEKSQNTRKRIAASGCNVIVPLGAIALSACYNESAIMKWRGSILQGNEFAAGKKLVPSVHPAACLRGQYLWRHMMISDLDKARVESEFPDMRSLMDRNIRIDPTLQESILYLLQCQELESVAFDIEVLNHQVSCISFAKSETDGMSIPFVGSNGYHKWSEEDEVEVWTYIARLLGDPTVEKVGQNLMFDISFLLDQMGIFTRGPIADTMIAHHIMYPDFPKGLDFLCSMHTNQPYYKDDRKLWSKPWVDLETFWRYNARDSLVCAEMWPQFKAMMIADDYWETYQDTIDIFPSLLYMMIRGMNVDIENLKRTKVDVEKKIKIKEQELKEASDYEFNPGSPKQCIAYFYIHKGIKPYISRTTGNPTTDDKALSRIIRRYNLPEARIVQELRALNKLYGTYLDVGLDSDNRAHCFYNPRGTTTGRLSSSKTLKGTGMNMQNLHPDFKGFLTADN